MPRACAGAVKDVIAEERLPWVAYGTYAELHLLTSGFAEACGCSSVREKCRTDLMGIGPFPENRLSSSCLRAAAE